MKTYTLFASSMLAAFILAPLINIVLSSPSLAQTAPVPAAR